MARGVEQQKAADAKRLLRRQKMEWKAKTKPLLNAMKKAHIQEILKRNSLNTDGSKNELMERIYNNIGISLNLNEEQKMEDTNQQQIVNHNHNQRVGNNENAERLRKEKEWKAKTQQILPSMRKNDIIKILKHNRLDHQGRKSELIDRIQRNVGIDLLLVADNDDNNNDDNNDNENDGDYEIVQQFLDQDDSENCDDDNWMQKVESYIDDHKLQLDQLRKILYFNGINSHGNKTQIMLKFKSNPNIELNVLNIPIPITIDDEERLDDTQNMINDEEQSNNTQNISNDEEKLNDTANNDDEEKLDNEQSMTNKERELRKQWFAEWNTSYIAQTKPKENIRDQVNEDLQSMTNLLQQLDDYANDKLPNDDYISSKLDKMKALMKRTSFNYSAVPRRQRSKYANSLEYITDRNKRRKQYNNEQRHIVRRVCTFIIDVAFCIIDVENTQIFELSCQTGSPLIIGAANGAAFGRSSKSSSFIWFSPAALLASHSKCLTITGIWRSILKNYCDKADEIQLRMKNRRLAKLLEKMEIANYSEIMEMAKQMGLDWVISLFEEKERQHENANDGHRSDDSNNHNVPTSLNEDEDTGNDKEEAE